MGGERKGEGSEIQYGMEVQHFFFKGYKLGKGHNEKKLSTVHNIL